MNTTARRLALTAALVALAPACAPAERSCASSGDCLSDEACVLSAEGGRCLPSRPVAGEPADPGQDPSDPVTPPDDPSDPVRGSVRVREHGVVAGAGAARSASFHVVQRLASSPRQALASATVEVRP
ncbi:MAG: hypothetical protein IT383_05805 [Deltaproteobacteria bacterium]|nr:hypothetical protein [Deltaproteobacteria bacterium]